ncbi:MAG: hypothetical protein R3F11_17380 [Verrucomicrobiales bacterium]
MEHGKAQALVVAELPTGGSTPGSDRRVTKQILMGMIQDELREISRRHRTLGERD